MATTQVDSRQYPLRAVADLGIANIGTGNGITFKLPPNSLLTDVNSVQVTAFNSATTTTLSASDGTTTFLSAVDAKAAANVKYSATVGKFYPSGATITISMAETGATATAGRALAYITYLVVGRSNELSPS